MEKLQSCSAKESTTSSSKGGSFEIGLKLQNICWSRGFLCVCVCVAVVTIK